MATPQPAAGASDAQSMTDRIKGAKDITDQEAEANTKSLSQSKGRGQVTATSAMSIVNVALLKTVLDRGPIGNSYYMVSLVLISVSLALQVLAGLLSLMLDHMVNYLTKYDSTYSSDYKNFCCPWLCVRNKATKTPPELDASTSGLGAAKVKGENRDPFPWDAPGIEDPEAGGRTGMKDSPICGCCPFMCAKQTPPRRETHLLKQLEECRMNPIENQMLSAQLKEQLQYLTQLVSAAKVNLTKLDDESVSQPNEAEIVAKKDRLNKELQTAQENKKKVQRQLKGVELTQEQGQMLTDYYKAIRKNSVLKMAAHWQHQLNYIFYIIFVINIFITGFGLDTGTQPSEGVTSPAPRVNLTA